MNNKIFIVIFIFALNVCISGFSDYLYAQVADTSKTVFENKCSQCHGVSRALSKTKSLDGWMITTKRMSKKTGSNISAQEAVNIAKYLYSLDKNKEK